MKKLETGPDIHFFRTGIWFHYLQYAYRADVSKCMHAKCSALCSEFIKFAFCVMPSRVKLMNADIQLVLHRITARDNPSIFGIWSKIL